MQEQDLLDIGGPAVEQGCGSPKGGAGAEERRQQSSAIFNAALECLAELVTRSADNCREAVRQRAVPLLTSYISSHTGSPPNPAALRVLHQMVTCRAHAEEIHDNIMTCLTIPALVHLLNASLLHAGEHCGVGSAALCLTQSWQMCNCVKFWKGGSIGPSCEDFTSRIASDRLL